MSIEKRTTHFRGRVISLTLDEVTLPNGYRASLEIVHHPGGAAIVALDSEQRVCLLKQFRHAAGEWLWELPAGKLEQGEPALYTAQRELAEEAGVDAARWQSLGICHPSPGVLTEVVHLYLATGLTPANAKPESGEVFEVHWIALEEAYRQVLDGTISDAKTALGLARALRPEIAASPTPPATDS